MTQRPPNGSSERPRSEPEIIPPPPRGRARPEDFWTSGNERTTHRVHVTRLGPLAMAALLLAIAAVAGLLVIVLVGALLIWLPVAATFVAIALIVAWWKGFFRR